MRVMAAGPGRVHLRDVLHKAELTMAVHRVILVRTCRSMGQSNLN